MKLTFRGTTKWFVKQPMMYKVHAAFIVAMTIGSVVYHSFARRAKSKRERKAMENYMII